MNILGTNISIYLDDETIEWLDQMCSEWGLTRGKAISFFLKESRHIVELVLPMINQDPRLKSSLEKLFKGK